MKNKTLVVFMGGSKLESGLVSLGEKPKVEKRKSFDWNADNLSDLFKKIKKIYRVETIKIVYDPEVSEIAEFSIPKDVTNEPSFVGLKMAEKIPGILDRKDWGFKSTGETNTQKEIVVYALKKELWEKVNLIAKEVGFLIGGMEPLFSAEKRSTDPLIGAALKESSIVILEKPKEETISEPTKDIPLEKTEEKTVTILAPDKNHKKGKTFLLLVGIVLLIAGLVVGGILFSQKALKSARKTAPSPTSIPTLATTPTPEIAKKDLKISVLNGSGIPGLAGKAKTYLEELGYQVVNTGNAEVYTYEQTEVSIKENKKMFLEEILKSLGEKYTLSDDNPTLDSQSEFDIVIKLGKK